MKITLSGYYPLVRNSVYAKRNIGKVKGGTRDIASVITICKYTEPSEDQVIELIQKKAYTTYLRPAFALRTVGLSNLEDELIKLPRKALGLLYSDDDSILDFLRANTFARVINPGEIQRKFIMVRYGYLPYSLIEENRANLRNYKEYEHYLLDDKLVKPPMGGKWRFNLLIKDGDVLPDKREIEILLKHGAPVSRIINFDVREYNTEEVTEVVKSVYSGLDSGSNIGSLTDISEKVLLDGAVISVKALNDMIEEERGSSDDIFERKEDSKLLH